MSCHPQEDIFHQKKNPAMVAGSGEQAPDGKLLP